MGNSVCEIAKSSFFEHDLGHIFGNFWFHWCCRIFVFWTFCSEKLNHVLITILKNSLVQTTKLKKTLEKTRLEVDNDSQTTYPSLREKYPNMKFFLVRIFPHSNWIRRDTKYLSLFSPNARKYGPEKTPYLNTFHAVHMNFISLKTRKSFEVSHYLMLWHIEKRG